MGRRSTATRAAMEGTPRAGGPEQLDLDGLLARLVVPPDRLRTGGATLPTQKRFVFSPTMHKAYMGPLGCAKTATLCAAAILPGLWYPGSRWLITRKTQEELKETTLREFREQVSRLGPGAELDFKKGPPARVLVASARPGPDGKPGEPSEYVFHSVWEDPLRFGSTEWDGIAIDETSEIDDSAMVHTLKGRLRHRRPDGAHGPYFFLMAFNPTDRGHWLWRELSGEPGCPDPWAEMFRPLRRENEGNLPPGYYDQMTKGMSPAMIARFRDGEWGPDPSGKPVFPEFSMELHTADLKYLASLPMIRGWDFGRRRPAVVWAQATPEGWVNRLYAKLGEDTSLRQWAQGVLQESAARFPGVSEWLDFCDPHGGAAKDDGKSSFEVLRELNIHPISYDTSIAEGLEALSAGFNTLINRRPRAQYDRRGCALLADGYLGGYVWPTTAKREKPVADGYYEHLVDADRYLAIGLKKGGLPLPQFQVQVPTNLRRHAAELAARRARH